MTLLVLYPSGVNWVPRVITNIVCHIVMYKMWTIKKINKKWCICAIIQLVQRITCINYRQLRMITQRINKYRTFRLNVSPPSQTQYLLNIATNILDTFFYKWEKVSCNRKCINRKSGTHHEMYITVHCYWIEVDTTCSIGDKFPSFCLLFHL